MLATESSILSFFARCFGSGIVVEFKYFFTVFQSYPVLSDMSVMLKPCAYSSLIMMYSSISSIVSNPGIYAQDCYVGIFIPLKMGNFRPLLTNKYIWLFRLIRFFSMTPYSTH